jgi:hypothetical protein
MLNYTADALEKIVGLREMLTITKSSHREEARRVVQCPHAPAHRSTIQIEFLLFDSERQLCHRHGLYSNHCSCRAHSITSHIRDHDAPQLSRDFQSEVERRSSV